MSGRDYRIIKQVDVLGVETWGVHEVLYDAYGYPRWASPFAAELFGETKRELESEFNVFAGAFLKPVLDMDVDFPAGMESDA